ncbi:MAG: MBL fold metallo-hydrolase [Flavobacteriaceae bacterium]
MKVTFLGTGTSQGIPVIGSTHPVCLSTDFRDKRLRTSVMIEIDATILVIDCGPDFRAQMLRAKPSHLDAVLFTHEHSDHTAGLDDIRPFYFRQEGDFQLYGHHRVFESLKQRFAYIFETKNKYPGAPTVALNEIHNNVTFSINNVSVTPINAYHNTLQVFGFRINDFVYMTDVKTVPDAEIDKLKNVKVLVINALREHEHHSHFTLQEALQFIERIAPEKAYLTHVSHELGFYKDVQQSLPKNVFLAYDTLTLNF